MARLASRLMKDPVRIAVAGKKATLETIEQRLDLVAGSWDGKTSTGTLDALKLDSSFATAEGRGGASVGKELEIRDSSLTLKADLEKHGVSDVKLTRPNLKASSGTVEVWFPSTKR